MVFYQRGYFVRRLQGIDPRVHRRPQAPGRHQVFPQPDDIPQTPMGRR
jgi:hypothetical protein